MSTAPPSRSDALETISAMADELAEVLNLAAAKMFEAEPALAKVIYARARISEDISSRAEASIFAE